MVRNFRPVHTDFEEKRLIGIISLTVPAGIFTRQKMISRETQKI